VKVKNWALSVMQAVCLAAVDEKGNGYFPKRVVFREIVCHGLTGARESRPYMSVSRH
jgi:hypothetical protein